VAFAEPARQALEEIGERPFYLVYLDAGSIGLMKRHLEGDGAEKTATEVEITEDEKGKA
jgi:hypothetical protein